MNFESQLADDVCAWLREKAEAGEPWQGIVDIRAACVGAGTAPAGVRSLRNLALFRTVLGLVERGRLERRERREYGFSYGRFEVRAAGADPREAIEKQSNPEAKT